MEESFKFIRPEDFAEDSSPVVQLTIENSQLLKEVRDLTDRNKQLEAEIVKITQKYRGVRPCRKCRSKSQSHGSSDASSVSRVRDDETESVVALEEIINQLFEQLEIKHSDMQSIIASYECKLQTISNDNVEFTSELIQRHETEVESLTAITREYETLIQDIIVSCEGLFQELQAEFEKENLDSSTNGSGQRIWIQFKNLGETAKGLIVTSICIISRATAGWVGWKFLIWIWPKLISNIETICAVANLVKHSAKFVNSPPFRKFQDAWQRDRPLNECLQEFSDSSQLSSMMAMAPQAFSVIKGLTNPIRA